MNSLSRKIFTAVATASLFTVWTASHAEIGELLKKCTICHGEQGISAESAYPSIAGIPVAVQVDAMHGYREGTRDCGAVMEMCRISANLTDEEILELSEYFAAFPFVRAQQEFDAELAAEGALLHEDYCEVCHGDSPDHADRSILHGQWMDYLRYSLSQYKIGARKQPPSMRRQTEKLSDEEIEALIHFYASYGAGEKEAASDK